MFRVRSYGIQVRKWVSGYCREDSMKPHSNLQRVVPNSGRAQINTDKQSWPHFRSSRYNLHGQQICKFNDLLVNEGPRLKTAGRQWVPARINTDRQLWSHFKSFDYSLHGQRICKFSVFKLKQATKILIYHDKRLVEASFQQSSLSYFILLFFRPLVRLSSFVFGKLIKRWWHTLPVDVREQYVQKMQQRWYTIIGGFLGFGLVSIIWYHSLLEEDYLHHRERIMLVKDEQMLDYARAQADAIAYKFKGKILQPGNALRMRVVRVAYKLIDANRDMIKPRRWRFYVIDSDMKNAFILPDGSLFIFTGLFKLIDNDDQLGFILGHELAHVILSHAAEQLSDSNIAELFLLIPAVLLWAILPDVAALFFHIMSSYVASVLFVLPKSREMEMEADEIGLKLAARACFDVHQAQVLWKKVHGMIKADNYVNAPIEWLSTHPRSEDRLEALSEIMFKACQERTNNGCPPLAYTDPCLAARRKPRKRS